VLCSTKKRASIVIEAETKEEEEIAGERMAEAEVKGKEVV